jgi:hypothetical protein
MRLRFVLSLLIALGFTVRPVRAQELARLDLVKLAGPGVAPSTASTRGAEPVVPFGEATRADAWVFALSEARGRRERVEKWAVPLMFGLATVAGTGAAVLAKDTAAQLTFAGSAVLAAAELGTSFAVPVEQRGPFFALGGSLFAATFSAGAMVDSYRRESCEPHCYDHKAFGWLAGALAAEALTFFPLALVDRGPTRADYESYARLPIDERPHAARMLLARVDRAERKALTISLSMQLAALAVLATGAAVVRDDQHQTALLAVSGVGFAMTSATTFASLLRPTRLERFVSGERPDSVERVFW